MSADVIMEEEAQKNEWPVDLQLYLALEYIDNQKDNACFLEFLQVTEEERSG